MKRVETVEELRSVMERFTGAKAFVPTMGNLHEGHISLVREARTLADHVVVSIFVNPLQFGANEDINSYPRTVQSDVELLQAEGVDLLFTPTEDVIYPGEREQHTRVEVPVLSDTLCGASRPGHFTGVATVVCKLFNMVQPDMAVFGKKDYQQLLVIRKMVGDLALPVAIRGADTIREDDGLAMSSRNGYLTQQERSQAPALYTSLKYTAERINGGDRNYAELERAAINLLQEKGLRPDYFQIRNAADLALPRPEDRDLVVLAAAYLGKARLIDNLEIAVMKS